MDQLKRKKKKRRGGRERGGVRGEEEEEEEEEQEEEEGPTSFSLGAMNIDFGISLLKICALSKRALFQSHSFECFGEGWHIQVKNRVESGKNHEELRKKDKKERQKRKTDRKERPKKDFVKKE